MGSADARVWTVGHSTHSLEAFVDLLDGAGLGRIVDVRSFPGSRRVPQFNAEALARDLPAAGLDYVHLPALGGRRRGGADSPNSGWEHASFRAYADHMASEEFAAGLLELRALARDRATAIMCAEAPWWRCHRRLVADALVAAGHPVCHVMPDGRVHEHELTPFAVVTPGGLVYPPPQGSLLDA